MLCDECEPASIPHIKHDGCPACAGKVLLPSGGPTPDVWTCACTLWEEEFGDRKVDTGIADEGREWDDEVVWGVEREDRMLAEKLHAEWSGKQGG
jgi:hypothetical protein